MSAYALTWKRFKLTTRFGTALFVTALAAACLGALAADSAQWGKVSGALLVTAVVCGAVAVVCYAFQLLFRCPRCHQYFFFGKVIVGKPSITRHCVTCNLELYDEA